MTGIPAQSPPVCQCCMLQVCVCTFRAQSGIMLAGLSAFAGRLTGNKNREAAISRFGQAENLFSRWVICPNRISLRERAQVMIIDSCKPLTLWAASYG